jgi:hypothetical protein
VDAIVRLLRDPERRHQLGMAGRQFVESHHCWERCLAPLDMLLRLPNRRATGLVPAAEAAETTPAQC